MSELRRARRLRAIALLLIGMLFEWAGAIVLNDRSYSQFSTIIAASAARIFAVCVVAGLAMMVRERRRRKPFVSFSLGFSYSSFLIGAWHMIGSRAF